MIPRWRATVVASFKVGFDAMKEGQKGNKTVRGYLSRPVENRRDHAASKNGRGYHVSDPPPTDATDNGIGNGNGNGNGNDDDNASVGSVGSGMSAFFGSVSGGGDDHFVGGHRGVTFSPGSPGSHSPDQQTVDTGGDSDGGEGRAWNQSLGTPGSSSVAMTSVNR